MKHERSPLCCSRHFYFELDLLHLIITNSYRMKNQQWTMSNTNRTFASMRNAKFTAGFLLIAFLFGSFLGQSQSLSDFASAAGGSKMAVVPYPDLKKTIVDAQKVKDDAQKAISGKFSDLKFSKTKTLESIGIAKANVSEAKKKLAADKGTSSSETSKLKSEVSTKEDVLEGHEKKLKELDAQIKTTSEKWNDLYNARLDVKKKYIAVKDALQVSLSNPSKHIGSKPSSSDKEAYSKYQSDEVKLKEYVATIKTKMNSEFSKHEPLITEAKGMVDKYKELLALN